MLERFWKSLFLYRNVFLVVVLHPINYRHIRLLKRLVPVLYFLYPLSNSFSFAIVDYVNFLSFSSISRSLILAYRLAIYPFTSNSQFSFP